MLSAATTATMATRATVSAQLPANYFTDILL